MPQCPKYFHQPRKSTPGCRPICGRLRRRFRFWSQKSNGDCLVVFILEKSGSEIPVPPEIVELEGVVLTNPGNRNYFWGLNVVNFGERFSDRKPAWFLFFAKKLFNRFRNFPVPTASYLLFYQVLFLLPSVMLDLFSRPCLSPPSTGCPLRPMPRICCCP